MKKPSKAYIDADVLLFQTASAAEQVNYVYYDGTTPVARFESAKAGKNWLAEIDMLGCDPEFGFDGNPDTLTRETEWIDIGFDECKKAWKTATEFLVKDLTEWSPNIKCNFYVSAASGLENFRYSVATIAPYKGNRNGTRKPKYLEELRQWVVKEFDNVTAPKIRYEVDDLVNAMAKKAGKDGLAVGYDKDIQGISGAWFWLVNDYDNPVYSDPSLIGTLELTGKDKVLGSGTLFWLWQCMASDTADNIKGCRGIGKKKAYDILKDYSGKGVEYLPEVLGVVGKVFKGVYGEEFTYKHCYTGEEVTVGWYDVFKENFSLVMMLSDQNDSAEKSVLKYLDKEGV